MTSVRNRLDRIEAAIAESDPLPPEDRVPSVRHSSLELLYRSHAPRLLRMFRRRVDQEEAHDLVQDSFLRYVRSPGTWGENDKPRAHLDTIAENVLRNRARAAYLRSIVVQDPDLAEQGAVDIVPSLEARDMLDRVQKAMRRLSPKTREIFLAHRLDGATYAEIARSTGLSLKGVEWHMSKALAAIHRAAKRG